MPPNSAGHDDGADSGFQDFLRSRLEALRRDVEQEVARIAGSRARSDSDAAALPIHSEMEGIEEPTFPCAPKAEYYSPGYFSSGSDGAERTLQMLDGFTPTIKNVSSASVKRKDVLRSFAFSTPSTRPSLYTGGIENGHNGVLSGIMYTVATSTEFRGVKTWPMLGFMDKWGEWVISAITVANAVTIGLCVDHSPSWIGWIIIDAFFALAFLLHMLFVMYRLGVRTYFSGQSRRFNLMADDDLRWRWFEFLLVMSAFAEVAVGFLSLSTDANDMPPISIFRLLRLTRIARLLRFAKLRIFAELSMMINGAIGGMRALFWSLIMIALPLYAVALLMHESLSMQTTAGGEGFLDLFDSLGMTLFTLFRCVVGGDCATQDGKPVFLLITRQYGSGYGLVYCFLMMFMVFGIFNVIAAIFVENTLNGAKHNHITEKRNRLRDNQLFAEKIAELVRFVARKHKLLNPQAESTPSGSSSSHSDNAVDEDIDDINLGTAMQIEITPLFMQQLCREPKFQELLRTLDIGDSDQLDLFETLDVDGNGTIDLEELIIGLRKLRGDARKSDIVGVALIVRSTQLQMNAFKDQTLQSIVEIQHALLALHGLVSPRLAQTSRRQTSDEKTRATGTRDSFTI